LQKKKFNFSLERGQLHNIYNSDIHFVKKRRKELKNELLLFRMEGRVGSSTKKLL
tara:strand:+ start:213 stop:377 length:165 start_codon:yes stop_codon:yes gene_type:complete